MGAPPTGTDLALEAARRVETLRKQTGLPASLSEVGIARALLPKLTEKAFEDGCHRSNPKPVTAADLGKLYEAAY